MDDSQAFQNISSNANRNQQYEDADVDRAPCEATLAAPAPIKKHHASGDERNAEGVHHHFVDSEVDALVKHWIVGLAP